MGWGQGLAHAGFQLASVAFHPGLGHPGLCGGNGIGRHIMGNYIYPGLDDGPQQLGDLTGIGVAASGKTASDATGDDTAKALAMAGLTDLISHKKPTKQGSASTLGVFMGDGLPPVSAKLADKIGKGEFVEMFELLPEFWTNQGGEGDANKQVKRPRSNKKVQDINVWLQCYALYVGVRALKAPNLIPELMAYQISILRASQEYEGTAWATYDAAYRRQAATTGHTEWSKINPSLYTLCFTGKAKKAPRCEMCLSAAHKTEDCPLAGDDDPDMAKRMKAIESAVVAFSSSNGNNEAGRSQRSMEICRLFNEKRCRFRNCKYRHVCSGCKGFHPVPDCPMAIPPGARVINGKPGPVRRENTYTQAGKNAGPY